MNRWLILAALCCAGCATTDTADHDLLYQVSTFSALQESVYDGTVSVGELKKHGNLGIGTFNGLDGELILLEGTVYQGTDRGTVGVMPDEALTPFAAVTHFDHDFQQPLSRLTDYTILKNQIDPQLPSRNLPYAVRIDGLFSYVKTRAPHRQSPPYPRLVDALADQPEFEYRQVRGTLVGFRLPQFMNGANVPGWHLHFISDDRSKGGHVMAFTVDEARLYLDQTPQVLLVLPEGGSFMRTDLSRDASHETERIEGGR